MKILWFTNIPLYTEVSQYNGGGWMYALRDELLTCADVELAVAYYANGVTGGVVKDHCRYYNIDFRTNLLRKIQRRLYRSTILKEHLDAYTSIIEDFKPDVIHIFGTENAFGLISKTTKIPTVLHIQSILNSYINAYFPPGVSMGSYFSLDLKTCFKEMGRYKDFKQAALREREILSSCKYYMGRTAWDKTCVELLSKDYQYFHVDEMLRQGFYEDWERKSYNNNGKLKIATVISDTPYKGLDLIVKAAQVLKERTDITFDWNVFGNIAPNSHFIKQLDINKIGIKLRGIVSESEVIDHLKLSDVYVHPSYIEGSSNSVCEAQMMGLPIIACNVGGIDYMIKNNDTGLLVPANDPYAMAYQLKRIFLDSNLAQTIGQQGRQAALIRHNKKRVLEQVLLTYSNLVTK